MMTSGQVVGTSLNVTTKGPSLTTLTQDYTHPDDHTSTTYDDNILPNTAELLKKILRVRVKRKHSACLKMVRRKKKFTIDLGYELT